MDFPIPDGFPFFLTFGGMTAGVRVYGCTRVRVYGCTRVLTRVELPEMEAQNLTTVQHLEHAITFWCGASRNEGQ